MAVISGTTEAEALNGTDAADTINALAGNDTVTAAAGADLVYGNEGDDVLYYGTGANTVYGGQGDDVISSDEEEIVTTDVQLIYGGQGEDEISIVGDGNNTVFGGSAVSDSTDGTDSISILGTGNNLVYGNGGNDFVIIAASEDDAEDAFVGGNNTVYGGAGDDEISVLGGASDSETLISGGAGRDFINVASAGAVTVFGGDEAFNPSDQSDFINITLLGDEASAVVYGNGGSDSITVTGAVFGEEGQVEDASAGSATVYGGQGSDEIFASVNSGLISGGIGSDSISAVARGEDASVTVFGGNEVNSANDSGDIIQVSVVDGGSAYVYGNGGNDSIGLGGSGDEESVGNYQVFGGQGLDSIIGGVGDGSLVMGGVGTDFISVTVAGDEASVTVYGGNGSEDPADQADYIFVGVNGEGQTATIYGNGGDDVIFFGGEGSVVAYGGQGNDTFIVDDSSTEFTVTGGLGADTFGISGEFGSSETSAVGVITDLNLDEDIFGVGGEIDTAVDLVDFSPTSEQSEQENSFADIGAAESLDDAAVAAINFLVEAGLASEDEDSAVLFSYGDQDYMAVDVGTDGTIDGIVQVTGYTGTFDTNDFGPLTGFPA